RFRSGNHCCRAHSQRTRRRLNAIEYSITWKEEMRGVKKENLPQKICVVCGRPFAWRKKWARVWNEVKYCSDACRARRQS
ncbi:MAG TPA: DUF2256 domain-containing protein, partial [Abditibacteriaceae bacterium]|nr:DUF2256 domain-containing protein [Abditibacteriaceae bacterium]